jgi:hypothetical protein
LRRKGKSANNEVGAAIVARDDHAAKLDLLAIGNGVLESHQPALARESVNDMNEIKNMHLHGTDPCYG